MVNKKFECYKISREIKRSGIECTFKRKGENEYGEPEDNPIVIGNVICLYHEQNSQITISTGDTTQTRSKKIPSLLCLSSDIESLAIKVGDMVEIDGSKRKFQTTGVLDVQEWHLISDISLEIIDEGVD